MRGITANAIDVVVETGDSGPVTPVGINLPNDQSVREEYGSKSISLSNVTEAYELSRPPAYRREFAWTEEEAVRAEKWGSLAGELSTDMHEVIGHASGRLADRLEGNPQAFLKEHYSALEEARADLVALYFIADPKLVEIGAVPADDHEDIIRAPVRELHRATLSCKLRRVREGSQLEEDHMRNRQMIVHWMMDNSDAIEVRERDGGTFYVNDRLGRCFTTAWVGSWRRFSASSRGGLQDAGKQLFESYGIHFDPALRDQVLVRVARVNLPSYSGFVMPKLEPVTGSDGEIVTCRSRIRRISRSRCWSTRGRDKVVGFLSQQPAGTPARRAFFPNVPDFLIQTLDVGLGARQLIERIQTVLFDRRPLERIIAGVNCAQRPSRDSAVPRQRARHAAWLRARL